MKRIITILYKINLLILLMWGAHAWFLWELDNPDNMALANLYAFISCCIALAYNSIVAKERLINGATCLIILFIIIGNLFHTLRAVVLLATTVIKYVPLIVLFMDKQHAQEHLVFVAKGIALIFIPGIIIHIYDIFEGLPIGLPIQHPFSENYVFLNYIFSLKQTVLSANNDDVLRFQSVFLEPGMLGALCVFMLLALRFDFKKWSTWPIIMALVLSLSLAGYITGLLGYVVYQYSRGKDIRYFILMGVMLIPVYFGAKYYNDGENYLQTRIFDRLEYDEEKGIEGNNRFSSMTDWYYEQMWASGEIFTGLGPAEVEEINGDTTDSSSFDNQINGAGYKTYFITRGLLGGLMFFLIYMILGPLQFIKGQKKYAYGVLFVYAVTFIQVAVPDSWSWLIPYVLGMNYYWMDLNSQIETS